MGFDLQPHAPCVLRPEVRELTPSGRRNWLHKFLRNAGFYLTTRNPPVVQVEFEQTSITCNIELGVSK